MKKQVNRKSKFCWMLYNLTKVCIHAVIKVRVEVLLHIQIFIPVKTSRILKAVQQSSLIIIQMK